MNKTTRQCDFLGWCGLSLVAVIIAASVLIQAAISGWPLPFVRPVAVQARPIVPLPANTHRPPDLTPAAFRADRVGQLILDAGARVPLREGEPTTRTEANITHRRFATGTPGNEPAPAVETVTALAQALLGAKADDELLAAYGLNESLNARDEKRHATFGRRQSLVVKVADQLTGATARTVELTGE